MSMLTTPRIVTNSSSTPPSYTHLIEKIGNSYQGKSVSGNFKTASSDLIDVWNDILDNGQGEPMHMKFGMGTFTVNSGVMEFDRDDIVFSGMGRGITNLQGSATTGESDPLIRCVPTNAETPIPINTTTVLQTTVTTSTASDAGNISAGDVFVVYNNEDVPNDIAGLKKGEIHRAFKDGVSGTGVIEIEGVIEEGFSGATAPHIVKLDPFRWNVGFKDMTISSLKNNWTGFTRGTISLAFCGNVGFENVDFDNCFDSGAYLMQCIDAQVSNCRFKNVKPINSGANNGFGVTQLAGRGCTVTGCIFDGGNISKSGVVNGGIIGVTPSEPFYGYSRGTVVTGNEMRNMTVACFNGHASGKDAVVVGNLFESSTRGVTTRTPTLISNNRIVYCSLFGIRLQDSADNCTIHTNQFHRTNDSIDLADNVSDISIALNSFKSCTGTNIDTGGGTGISSDLNRTW